MMVTTTTNMPVLRPPQFTRTRTATRPGSMNTCTGRISTTGTATTTEIGVGRLTDVCRCRKSVSFWQMCMVYGLGARYFEVDLQAGRTLK